MAAISILVAYVVGTHCNCPIETISNVFFSINEFFSTSFRSTKFIASVK